MAAKAPFDAFLVNVPARDLYGAGTVCLPIPKRVIPFVLGAMESLRYPLAWDGSDDEIRLVTSQVEHFISSLVLYDNCEEPQTPDNGQDEPQPRDWGIQINLSDCEGGIMSNSVCVGPGPGLRWNAAGQLEVYCYGQWVTVPGANGETVTTPDDEAPLLDDIISGGNFGVDKPQLPDVSTIENYGCRKAAAYADAIYDVAAYGVGQYVQALGAYAFMNAMRTQFPVLSLSKNWLWVAYAYLGIQNGLEAITPWPEYSWSTQLQDNLQCSIYRVVDGSTRQVTYNEHQRVVAAAVDAAPSIMRGYIGAIAEAIEVSGFSWLAVNALDQYATAQCDNCGNPYYDTGPDYPGLLDPTSSGWYLSEPINFEVTVPATTGTNTWQGFCIDIPPVLQETYGLWYNIDSISPAGESVTPMKEKQVGDTTIGCDAPPAHYWGINSSYLLYQGNQNKLIARDYGGGVSQPGDEIVGRGNYQLVGTQLDGITFNATDHEYLTTQQPSYHYMRAGFNAAAAITVKMTVYRIHNINSPNGSG
jgi:hypothetical protein